MSAPRPGESARAPRDPELPAEPDVLEALSALAHEQSLEEVVLSDVELADERARGVSIRAAVFERGDLSGAAFEQLELSDVELRAVNVANLTLPRPRLHRVRAVSCRMTGLTISGARLSDVAFSGCRIDLASFAASALERVTFADCRLTQTDFMESQLQDVRFHDCDLTEADFRGARLRRCEARGCELTALEGVDRLRGLAMPWADIVANADVWAAALAIVALED